MSSAALIYFDDSFLKENVFNNEKVAEKIAAVLLKDQLCEKVIYSVSESFEDTAPEGVLIYKRTGNDITDWKNIQKEFVFDNYIKIYSDSPFIDYSIVKEMSDIHIKYAAEYTYSENLPEGLAPVIISADLIKTLPDEAHEKLEPLEVMVKKNINQFDVELYYKGPDIRDKRISFRMKSKRDFRIMENIYNLENKIPVYESIRELIDNNPEVLYIAPSYYEIEITSDSDTDTICSVKDKKNTNAEMPQDVFSNIIDEAEEFEMSYTLSLGGHGDPLNHPQFYSIMDKALGSTLLERIIIETFGTRADDNFINYIESKNDDRIHIIFKLNGYNSDTFNRVQSGGDFDQIYSNLLKLKNHFGEYSDKLYLEILKINETEDFLDQYYDHFEKEKINIILQKQNVYLGESEDRRYYDLSPVDRIPCWHLQRDIFILSNGKIPFCKQDFNALNCSAEIGEKTIKKIWQERKEYFLDDYKGNRCKNPDCSVCDEWYTFNF